MAKLLTYGGQVIDPTARIYIYIHVYIDRHGMEALRRASKAEAALRERQKVDSDAGALEVLSTWGTREDCY